jgi:hypothetical protein
MRTSLSAILVVLLASGGVGQLTTVPSAKSVEATLDSKEQELERLYASYWQIQYQLEQGDTSVSDKDVNRKIRDVRLAENYWTGLNSIMSLATRLIAMFAGRLGMLRRS